MNPLLPRRLSLTREDAWNGPDYSFRKGRRRPERFLYDRPPTKYARVHPSDIVHGSSLGRPPSLLDAPFPSLTSFENRMRRQQSPTARDRPYESRNRITLESWRFDDEPSPTRRAETSGAWVRPSVRLTPGVVDGTPKSLSQRTTPLTPAQSSKPIQSSNSANPEDDSIPSTDVVRQQTKTRDNYDDEEEQIRLAKIRSDLERMKQEDKEGYQLLLKALANSNDKSGSPQFTAERKDLVAEDSYPTKQGFIHRPDYEMKVEGSRKFQDNHDYPKSSRSPPSTPGNPVQASVGVKESDKKPLPLLGTPTPTSATARWESWRNLTSSEREASIRCPWKGNPMPASDSWRTSTVSPMASSWRSTSKIDGGNSPLKLGHALELNRNSELDLQGRGSIAEPFKKPTTLVNERLELSKARIPFRR